MKRTSSQSLIPVEKKVLNPTDYDMVYKPNDKGGVRQLFDRPTTMLSRFDIHITSLDPGISSHGATYP